MNEDIGEALAGLTASERIELNIKAASYRMTAEEYCAIALLNRARQTLQKKFAASVPQMATGKGQRGKQC